MIKMCGNSLKDHYFNAIIYQIYKYIEKRNNIIVSLFLWLFGFRRKEY